MPSVASEFKTSQQELLMRYIKARDQSASLCRPLQTEDYVAQPVVDVSPPKWHLAHTTWFFENFILVPHARNYKVFHKDFSFLFNSYYVSVGARWVRANRGNLTRPCVSEILDYRRHVDEGIARLFQENVSEELSHLMELGIQHEQQHQELLLYDIKFILGQNPLFPAYCSNPYPKQDQTSEIKWLPMAEGIYDIGYQGDGFHFDNEKGRHKVYLHEFELADRLVTNGEYLEFVNDGGYNKTTLWLSEGWDWRINEEIESPLYWIKQDGGWHHYTLYGLQPIDPNEPVAHISFYEADAFARWKGYRLPTEFEWESVVRSFASPEEKGNFVEKGLLAPTSKAGHHFLGNLWEWTASSYRPYPFYDPPTGAIGEYNGKFMSNQMVLRGGSFGTPKDHIRPTYRNFFHPHLRWLFSGLRLAKHV